MGFPVKLFLIVSLTRYLNPLIMNFLWILSVFFRKLQSLFSCFHTNTLIRTNMKHLFTLSFSLLLAGALFSQTTKTEKWKNGKDKSSGAYKYDVPVSANASKEDLSKISSQLVKVGKWQYWFETGQLQAEENYTDGQRSGIQKTWHPNGKPESVVDLNTKKATYWFDNGQKQSEGAVLSNMAPTGRWTMWHSNGQKNAEGAYNAAGNKDGVWQFWDSNGQLTGQQTYKNGIAQN
jgi:antitoxin component YwqK of YwqJK toxin-antitoxin module